MDAVSISGHRMPPGGAMDILFSFDTTGSMSYILDEVKGRLSDMIQRLQSDIPGIRLGVIAHGDYCDEEEFYLEKHIDFTQNVVDLCNFVGGIDGTGGGDEDECYELILRKAHQEFTWAPVSNKVLVMIGDANPHPPDYKLNVDNIDWREEVAVIAKMGIKIYAVQALNNDGADEFYNSMAEVTGGHYLRLENFSNICDFIMAICYRERDDGLFLNYEAEVAARQGTSGFHKDLNNMFATLRREDSKQSNISSTSKPDQVPPVSAKPIGRRGSYSSDSGASSSGCSSAEPSGTVHRYGSFSSVSSASSPSPHIPAVVPPLSVTPASSFSYTMPATGNSHRPSSPKQRRIYGRTSNKKRNTIPREKVPETKFKLRNLKWSSWKLAYSPEKPDDSRNWRKMRLLNGYKRKSLFSSSKRQKMYEVSVQTHPRGKLHVMYQTMTSSNLDSLNWCRRLFEGSYMRYRIHQRQIKRVIQQGCRVFVRRADVKKIPTITYSYAWSRSITGKQTPERTVVKNNKTLSGMDYTLY
ncbi:uncharacterized protein LOC111122301 [Crassostrea virginica]